MTVQADAMRDSTEPATSLASQAYQLVKEKLIMLEIRPGDFGVRYQIATVELAKGQLEQAQRHLEGLVKEAPRFTEAHV